MPTPKMHVDDVLRLRTTLERTDKATQQFLAPLLGVEPIQHLLITFLQDTSRSFEDHVWDPATQDVLCRLRDHPNRDMMQGHKSEVVDMFQAEMQRRFGSRDYIADIDAAQEDGKRKFKKGDVYPAMNAFKKSLEALLAFHEDDYYGEKIDPCEWEEQEWRVRYVTLCCNIAVCAIKLKDGATIELYANKALAVDERSSKALYALAKLHVMDHMYEDARVVIEKALDFHPENKLLVKFQREIDTAELKEMEARAELAEQKRLYDIEQQRKAEERAKLAEEKRAEIARAIEVTPLPALSRDSNFVQVLQNYFNRIKHQVIIDFTQLHNPDDGEPPLFACTVSDGTTGAVLAGAIEAPSKKAAKGKACKIALLKIWEMKRSLGTLLPEDEERWEAYERSLQDGPASDSPDSQQGAFDDVSAGKPLCLTVYERQFEVQILLNQLQMKRQLKVELEVENVSPSPHTTAFKCVCTLNGQIKGEATAISKKKARAEASQKAFDEAVSQGLIQFERPMEYKSESENDESTTQALP
ncbi:hypothetical protein Poli38472_011874 [Pythium oligandrum]|uniref:DRBM domain-containing protein n=1 Tax=Pythium oligandrum TaxID=41045 RepID=A0A8K1C8D3_PYTOL|nr:hypothetical protein Poli38472_011874 [Pythium oligandrum]|eukprot:TMW58286.1 hypothetical protein Poli38472_011874 [Pythium oligandrum]